MYFLAYLVLLHCICIQVKNYDSRREMSLRCLNRMSIQTSQRPLKREVFGMTSLRYLKYISKTVSFL